MGRVNYYINTWLYFRSLHETLRKETVLDFGSNYGMFLDSGKQFFPQEQYTGIDVDLEAIDEGRKLFPNARFIHYNRYNPMYNPLGDKNAWPDLDEKFDTVISYSVLTHATVEDTLDTIAWLYNRVKPGGKMFISWLDVENRQALKFFYAKRTYEFGRCDKIETDDYVYLIDDKVSKEPRDGMFLTFYKKDYLSSLLDNYNHTLVKAPRNAAGCFQDCVIISKP